MLSILKKILTHRCPSCHKGPLYKRYLTFHTHCSVCGTSFEAYKTEDGPAWITMMVVGHLFLPLVISLELRCAFPVWVSLTLWPLLFIMACLGFLPLAKSYFFYKIWDSKYE